MMRRSESYAVLNAACIKRFRSADVLRNRRPPETAADEDARLGALEQFGTRERFEHRSHHFGRQARLRHQVVGRDRVARLDSEQDVVQAIPPGIALSNIGHDHVAPFASTFPQWPCLSAARRNSVSYA